MMGAMLVIGTMGILVRVRKIYIPLILLIITGTLFALHIWFMGLLFPKIGGITDEWFPAYNPFIFGLHFLIGTLVAGALVWREKKQDSPSYWNDILFTIVTVGLFSFLWIIREAGDFEYTWLEGAHRFPFATIPIAFILFLIPGTKYLKNWLDNRVFRRIARLSYSTYLWHAIVIVLMTRFAFGGQHDLTNPEWFILAGVAFVGAFSLAWLSYTYIEIPVSNWWRVRSERV